MVTSMRMWVSLAALAVMVSWGRSANYQMLFYLWACAAAVTVVLASICVNPGFETHSAAGKRLGTVSGRRRRNANGKHDQSRDRSYQGGHAHAG